MKFIKFLKFINFYELIHKNVNYNLKFDEKFIGDNFFFI